MGEYHIHTLTFLFDYNDQTYEAQSMIRIITERKIQLKQYIVMLPVKHSDTVDLSLLALEEHWDINSLSVALKSEYRTKICNNSVAIFSPLSLF
jgi:hypothetical protein